MIICCRLKVGLGRPPSRVVYTVGLKMALLLCKQAMCICKPAMWGSKSMRGACELLAKGKRGLGRAYAGMRTVARCLKTRRFVAAASSRGSKQEPQLASIADTVRHVNVSDNAIGDEALARASAMEKREAQQQGLWCCQRRACSRRVRTLFVRAGSSPRHLRSGEAVLVVERRRRGERRRRRPYRDGKRG